METTQATGPLRSPALVSRLLRPEYGLLRFLRFGLVGGSGVLVNLAALWLLHDELNLPLEPSAVAAVALAIVNNFMWNNFWTFGATGVRPRRVAQFAVISLVGMAINVGILKALVYLGVHYLPADLAGILVATGWNFFANARWTWGGEPGAPVLEPTLAGD